VPDRAFHISFEQQIMPRVSRFPKPREKVLAGHGVQLVLPGNAANVPLSQSVQTFDPGLAANVPLAHEKQPSPVRPNAAKFGALPAVILQHKECSQLEQWRLVWSEMQ
jgi:hypothetical protein